MRCKKAYVLCRHMAWHRKLKEAQAKKAMEKKSRKVTSSNNNENKEGSKTNILLLANQIVNDIVLQVCQTDN